MTQTLSSLRKLANQAYKDGKFTESIAFYDQALQTKNSTTKQTEISTLYSNKAMCYFLLKKFEQALEEIAQALKHNKLNIKAWFYKGQSHYELKQFKNSVEALKRAGKIAEEQNLNVADDIGCLLRQAQRAKFESDEKKRIENLQCIKNYLTIAETCTSLTPDDKEKVKTLMSSIKRYESRPTPPDALYGKISFEIMKDPVITPSGATYERKHILEHLGRRGHFDPLTLQTLKPEQLITNFGVHEMIDDFVEQNPWVLDE